MTSVSKVLIATCVYPHQSSKSSGTFVANWAEQLQENGLNIRVYKRDHITIGSYLGSFKRVIDFYKAPSLYEYEWHGIQVYRQGIHLRLPLNYSKTAPSITFKKIRPIIEKIKKDYEFDLIYIATWGDLSLAMSWIARDLKIPYIASAIGDHTNLYYNKPNSIYYKYDREIFTGAKFVICVSKDLNKKVKVMTGNKSNTFTYYSGVNTSKFQKLQNVRNKYRKLFEYADDDFVIIFVGRITKEKGIYEIIDAGKILNKKKFKVKLLFVGEGAEKKKLKKYIQMHEISEKVTVVGGVGHEEICSYLNAADVFVLPSWMEGLPNVIMEASATELPVIATSVGGIPEIIVNNETGILINPRSPQEIAEKIIFIIRNPEIAANIGNNARQRMLNKFNYNDNGRLLVDKIKNIALN